MLSVGEGVAFPELLPQLWLKDALNRFKPDREFAVIVLVLFSSAHAITYLHDFLPLKMPSLPSPLSKDIFSVFSVNALHDNGTEMMAFCATFLCHLDSESGGTCTHLENIFAPSKFRETVIK